MVVTARELHDLAEDSTTLLPERNRLHLDALMPEVLCDVNLLLEHSNVSLRKKTFPLLLLRTSAYYSNYRLLLRLYRSGCRI